MKNVLALYVDPVDFSRPMHGSGNAAVARSAVKIMGDKFVYVGLTSHPEEVGKLVVREIEGRNVSVYAIAQSVAPERISVIPENLRFAMHLVRHLPAISKWDARALITRTYTVMWLLALLPRRWRICYYIPGLGNPMKIGRRPRLGRFLIGIYDRIQAMSLPRADALFAAASQPATDEFNRQMAYRGREAGVRSLPTAVDIDLFRPQIREGAREEFDLVDHELVLVFVGRLASVKGIPLLFDTLKELRRRGLNAILLLVGEGEDREALQALSERQGIASHIRFLGNQPPKVVARVLAAADVFVMASFTEGFSNAMVEAVASGRPLVSTEVSGASDLIKEGKNGFIVRERSAQVFADSVLLASALPEAERISRNLALEQFSEQRLWRVIQESWLLPDIQA